MVSNGGWNGGGDSRGHTREVEMVWLHPPSQAQLEGPPSLFSFPFPGNITNLTNGKVLFPGTDNYGFKSECQKINAHQCHPAYASGVIPGSSSECSHGSYKNYNEWPQM